MKFFDQLKADFQLRKLLVSKYLKSIPAFVLTYLSTFLLNSLDTVIIGNRLGRDSLNVMSLIRPVGLVAMSIGLLTSFGLTIVLAKAYGKNDINKIKKCYMAALVLLVIAISLCVILLIPISILLIKLNLKTPGEINEAYSYIPCFIISLIISNISLFGNNLLIAGGKSDGLLFLSLTESILHVSLTYLFVTNFDMGISGVACATLIAEGIRDILTIIFVFKRLEFFPLYKGSKRGVRRKVIEIIKAGVPETIVSVFASLELFFSNYFMKNYLPDPAAALIVRSMAEFALGIGKAFTMSFSRANSPFLGLAKSVDDTSGEKAILKSSIFFLSIILILITIISVIYPQMFFIIHGQSYDDYSLLMTRILISSLVFEGILFLFRNYFVMVNKKKYTIIVSLTSSGLIILLAFLFAKYCPYYYFLIYVFVALYETLFYFILYFKNSKNKYQYSVAYEITKNDLSEVKIKILDAVKEYNLDSLTYSDIDECFEKFSIFLETRKKQKYRIQIGITVHPNEILMYLLDSDKKMFNHRIDRSEKGHNESGMANFAYNYMLGMNYCTFSFIKDKSLMEE